MSTSSLITQLYIGYFNRAPDPAGLAYWESVYESGSSLTQIAEYFALQPESIAIYGEANVENFNVETFIARVYQNLFGRVAEPDGLAYWKGQLESGAVTPGAFIATVQFSANSAGSGADYQTLTNKTEVAAAYVEALNASGQGWTMESAKAVIAEVDSTGQSVSEAKADLAAFIETGVFPSQGGEPTQGGGGGGPTPPVYTIAVSPSAALEGDSGQGKVITYTVSRSGDISSEGSIKVSLSGSASEGVDYTVSGIVGGGVTFAAGAATASFTVTTTPDTLVEPNETVVATLGDITGGGSLGGAFAASATVINDDSAQGPTLSVSSPGGATNGSIPLSISVDPVAFGTVEVVISGVPASYRLSKGIQIDDDAWVVQAADLSGLTMNLSGGAATPGTLNLDFTAATIFEGVTLASTSEVLTLAITPSGNQQVGQALDGYIAGATVFADANSNGLLDDGEVFATTAADGSFVLTGGSGPLVVEGGTDITTGLPFLGQMKAPEGSSVVTPLTTLVQELVTSQNKTLAEAQTAVQVALNLPSNVDLTTFDPVHALLTSSSSATADAAAILAAGIQVQATIAQITAANPSADVVGALAGTIAASTPVDLANASTIEGLATASGTSPSVATAIGSVVAAANSTIAAGSSGSDAGQILTALSQAANVALGDTKEAIANTDFGNSQSVDNLQSGFTGAQLTNLVSQAPVGIVNLPIIGTLGSDVLTGAAGDDALVGLEGNDALFGGAGNDVVDGGIGVDLAGYSSATSGISVNMAAGTVAGDMSVGTDTLRWIEMIRGSNHVDTYDARNFNPGVQSLPGIVATFNEFEGLAGDDILYGNSVTRASYLNATAAVTADLAAGQAVGNASVGTDTFYGGVAGIRGSNFHDTLLGSDTWFYLEFFEGRGGDDYIDGRGGMDRVIYSNDPATRSGITINMAAGTVTGDSSIGTDTLRSIESIKATNFDDVYDATGFGAASTNAGSNAGYNEFEGTGGNDIIIGNGFTRISYIFATAAVTIDLDAAGANGQTGFASGDDSSVGTDILKGGVSQVRGSSFNDTLLGSAGNDVLDGGAGDDVIDGRGGLDLVRHDLQAAVTIGVHVQLAAGTVTGREAATTALTGTDTLRSIELIRGTLAADIYDARGFSGASANAGSNGTFNEIEGFGGDDIIVGNGNTRISFAGANAGVTVDLSAGGVATYDGLAQTGTASGNGVGTDAIFGGVTRVRGSNFDDFIKGSSASDVIEGGTGLDIAAFTGTHSQYTVTAGGSAGSSTVQDNTANRDGTDTLTAIELLDFADASQMNQRGLDLSSFTTLTVGKALFGTNQNAAGIGDSLTMGLNANGRLIDLRDGGTDTLTLAVTGTYGLHLLNVEVLVGSTGNDTVTLENQVLDNSMVVDLGNGTDTLHLAAGGNVLSVQNVEFVIGSASADDIHLLGNNHNPMTEVTGGGGADTIWASADVDHIVYTSVTESDANDRDIVHGFDVSQDLFDLRGLGVTSWTAATSSNQTVVSIFVGGNNTTPAMEIELVDTVGVLGSSNFVWM